MDTFELVRAILIVAAAYLIGGIPWSIIVARLTGRTDPRTIGSGRSVTPLLAALAREPDVEARDALVHALGASKDAAAVDGLVGALADSVPQLRESAAHMLGMLGDERAVAALVAATRDPDHEVRLTAVWALDALQQHR